MSNKHLLFSILVAASCILTGCDAFRSLAGRPTSDDIAQMRTVIAERQAAAERARLDSIERERIRVEDSLARVAALDTLDLMKHLLRTPSRVGGLATADTVARYCAVLGSFKDKTNAANYAAKIKDGGYEVRVIPFRNGFTAVGAVPSDDPAMFLSSLRRLQKEPFFPKDYWILVNE